MSGYCGRCGETICVCKPILVTGKLRMMGQFDVVEEDQPGGKYVYKRALLIEFDSDEDIRKAINDEACKFTFGESDTAE